MEHKVWTSKKKIEKFRSKTCGIVNTIWTWPVVGPHETHQTSLRHSRHLPDTFQTPTRHLQDTSLTFPRQPSDTLHTLPRYFILMVEYIQQEKSIWWGWVGGWVVLSGNNTTSWLHLASWNLPDSQLSWESKMEPSVAIGNVLKTGFIWKICINSRGE